MSDSDKCYLDKLFVTVEFDESAQSKKEIHIVEGCMADSVLDIWCKKDVPFPELSQYEIYEYFILKFELAFACFINPEQDWFRYNLKDIVYCDRIDKIREDNIEQYFA